MDSFATSVSVALQYGVPLRDLVNKFAHVRFEPSGFTGNQEIPIAKSIVDYIFRWLGSRFLSPDEKASLGLIDRSSIVEDAPAISPLARASRRSHRQLRPRPPRPRRRRRPWPTPRRHRHPTPRPRTPIPRRRRPSWPRPRQPSRSKGELAVIATNSNATNGNGHTNGNGNARSAPANGNGGTAAPITLNLGGTKVSFQTQADAPSCADCGSIMVRNGSCYKCLNCGSTSGCS